MNCIAAVDQNWAIGRNGKLLAHIPADLRYFREVTGGKVVVMGRKTLESFPQGRPLPNRINVVLTRDAGYDCEGVLVVHSMEEALEIISGDAPEDVFIIGGGQIYRSFLPYCDTAYIFRIWTWTQSGRKPKRVRNRRSLISFLPLQGTEEF